MIEFKKWGNGSQYYEVILKHDYNVITKMFRYKSLGMVHKEGSRWVSGEITGKTRMEVAVKLSEVAL